jgi:hypothetical protein
MFKEYRLLWTTLFCLSVWPTVVGNAYAQNTPSPFAAYENQFQTEKISRNGFDLYYRSFGSGEPVLILSCGPGDDCDYMLPVATEVTKYAHAILLEQRSTGRSLPPRVDALLMSLVHSFENRLQEAAVFV